MNETEEKTHNGISEQFFEQHVIIYSEKGTFYRVPLKDVPAIAQRELGPEVLDEIGGFACGLSTFRKLGSRYYYTLNTPALQHPQEFHLDEFELAPTKSEPSLPKHPFVIVGADGKAYEIEPESLTDRRWEPKAGTDSIDDLDIAIWHMAKRSIDLGLAVAFSPTIKAPALPAVVWCYILNCSAFKQPDD